jgi:hypothetical protein
MLDTTMLTTGSAGIIVSAMKRQNSHRINRTGVIAIINRCYFEKHI